MKAHHFTITLLVIAPAFACKGTSATTASQPSGADPAPPASASVVVQKSSTFLTAADFPVPSPLADLTATDLTDDINNESGFYNQKPN